MWDDKRKSNPQPSTPPPPAMRQNLGSTSTSSASTRASPCNLPKAARHGHPLRPIAPPHPLPLPPDPLLLPPHLPLDHRLAKPRIRPRCRNGHPRPSHLPFNAFPGLQPRRFVPLPAGDIRLDELGVAGGGGESLLEQPSAGQVGVFLRGYRV